MRDIYGKNRYCRSACASAIKADTVASRNMAIEVSHEFAWLMWYSIVLMRPYQKRRSV